MVCPVGLDESERAGGGAALPIDVDGIRKPWTNHQTAIFAGPRISVVNNSTCTPARAP
jgi:hypothetical protein